MESNVTRATMIAIMKQKYASTARNGLFEKYVRSTQ
jgi:hypothetical protein